MTDESEGPLREIPDRGMRQRLREEAARERDEASPPASFNPLSEEAFRRAFEQQEHSSECRFELLVSPDTVRSVAQATHAFACKRGLQVTVVKRTEEIPQVSRQTRFKYSYHWDGGGGSLSACERRIVDGEDVTVVLVREDDLLIGYGIAGASDRGCKVEIIDVDYCSRREYGLADDLKLSGQHFQIGVGHVIVRALMETCPRPMHVDATNSSSRYIFKSLGFIHDEDCTNPCILRMD